MENPLVDIESVVYRLTQGSLRLQQQTLDNFFARNATFSHPFCVTSGSRKDILSIFRWYKILSPQIKIRVNGVSYEEARQKLYVDISQTFRIWLVIPLGYRADVNLITVLQLTRDPAGLDLTAERPERRASFLADQTAGLSTATTATSSPITASGVTKPLPSLISTDTTASADVSHSKQHKYYIKSQTDLYQTDEFAKFISLFSLLPILVNLFRGLATWACIIGAFVFTPFTTMLQHYSDKQVEHRARTRKDPAFGPSYAGDMTPAELRREQQMDVWEAEAKVFGERYGHTTEDWEAGKMKMKMSMKMEKSQSETEAEKEKESKRKQSIAGLVAQC